MAESVRAPRLRDYLSIPFVVEAETVEDGAGAWVRRASCPDLADCAAEAPTIEDALERLERRRVDVIVGLLRTGIRPPVPRPPLSHYDAAGLVRRLGLPEIEPLLDSTADEIRVLMRQGT